MTFQLSEQTKIESQIGFLIGILIGAMGAWVMILFFTPWEWYFKVLSSIGSLGIIGSLSLSLSEVFKVRRNYIDTMKEMDKMREQSTEVIDSQMKGGRI